VKCGEIPMKELCMNRSEIIPSSMQYATDQNISDQC